MSRKYNSDHLEKNNYSRGLFKRGPARTMIQSSVHNMHFKLLVGFPDVFLIAVIIQYIFVKNWPS